MKQRKTPLRKCVACQEMMPKKELIRVVRTPEGDIQIDLKGKNPVAVPTCAGKFLASA